MLGRKKEKILDVFCFVLILSLLSLFVHEQKTTGLLLYQTIGCSLILTGIVHGLYASIRNKIVKKKIQRLKIENNFNQYLQYVDQCVYKRPDLHWLRFEKLTALFLCGEISDYQAYLPKVKARKKAYLKIIEYYNIIILYLCKEKYIFEDSCNDNSYLGKTVALLSKMEEGKSIKELLDMAYELYNCPVYFYKMIAALILSELYNREQNSFKRQVYFEKAEYYAPSKELLHHVQKRD